MKNPTQSRPSWVLVGFLAGAMLGTPLVSWSHDASQHAAPKVANGANNYKRSVGDYQVPDVVLTDYDDRPVRLRDLLAADDPVMMNFVFTTCSTICPVTTKVLSEVPDILGRDGRRMRMISVSIDPENDTPLQLKAYARSFQAGTRWKFLTGRTQDIKSVQLAFNSYDADKMTHEPVTLIRQTSSKKWIRIDGFATPEQLVQEYRKSVPQ
jgi:protein SCO1/2